MDSSHTIQFTAEHFRVFFDHAPIGKSMTAPNGQLLRVNSAFCEMLGYTREEMERLSFADITHPDDMAESNACVRALSAGAQDDWRMEKRYRSKSGEYVWTHVTTRMLRDETGAPVYFLTHILDITERKKMEAALKQTKAELEQRILDRTAELAQSKRLLDNTARLARVGGWEIDLRRNAIQWTDMVYDIHEVDKSYLPDLNTSIQFYDEEAVPVISEAVRAAVEEGKPFDVELQLVTAKNRKIWVRAVGQAVWENGSVVKVEGAFQDIDARKRADEELSVYRERLENLVVERTEKLAGAVVELQRTQKELDRSNHVLRAGRGISRLIVKETDARQLIDRTCDLLTGAHGYLSAWIALFRDDGSVRMHAAKNCPDFFDDVIAEINRKKRPSCLRLACESKDGTAVLCPKDACGDCRLYLDGQYGIAIAAVLRHDAAEIGMLVVTLPGDALVDQYEETLLADMASDLALAVRDIQRSEAVRQSQEEIAALYAQTPLMLFLLDADRRIRRINKMALEMVGGTEGSLVGIRDGNALRCVQALSNDKGCGYGSACENCVIRNTVMDCLHTGTVHYQVECPLVVQGENDVSTDMVYLISTTRLVMNGAHQVLICLQDVTKERQLQASLAQSDRLASMGMLAAGVAHEINNPLIYILYNLESLAADLPEVAMGMKRCFDEFVRYAGEEEVNGRLGAWSEVYNPHMFTDLVERAKQALEGTTKIREIARGLGAFSRVEKGDVRMVSLNSAVESAVNMAYNEIKYRARLVKDFGQTPEILGSEGRLAQVFLNLLINATHAIETGDVENNVIHIRTWTEGDAVFASVRDTGKGILPAHLGRLFDPFFTTKPKGVGTGIGLSISKSIIEEFGGDIWVDSEVGKGTTFTIRLKVPMQEGFMSEPSPRNSRLPSDAPRGRVLVVDDDLLVRNIISRMLAGRHEVVTAASGEEGRNLLRRDNRFDAIICDLIMPEISGMELFKWLARENADLAKHMIFVTGGAFTQKTRDFLSEVDNVQLDKPFTADAVLAAVQEMVSGMDSQATVHHDD